MKHTLFITALAALCTLAACNNGTPNASRSKTDSTATKMESKAEKNKKTIMKGMNAINSTHDAKQVLTDISADFTEYQDGSMPPVKGDSAKQALQQYLSAFPDMKAENSMYFADDHNVVVVSDYTMTFKNDLGPIKATGKSIKYKDVDMFTIDDNGMVSSHRNIYPNGAVFAQLGVDMAKLQAMTKNEMNKEGDKKRK